MEKNVRQMIGTTKRVQLIHDASTYYYLHPSEGPSVSLTKYLLTGYNYETWAKAITNALHGCNKFGIINGDFAKPSHIYDTCYKRIGHPPPTPSRGCGRSGRGRGGAGSGRSQQQHASAQAAQATHGAERATPAAPGSNDTSITIPGLSQDQI
ncbi:hypothetical protein RDABS01_008225 [Bienertia sinuspersici]